jgi:hypothetical protein
MDYFHVPDIILQRFKNGVVFTHREGAMSPLNKWHLVEMSLEAVTEEL